jgi:hypothetical protein
VTVKVVRADIETSKIDFTLVEEPRQIKPAEEGKPARKRKKKEAGRNAGYTASMPSVRGCVLRQALSRKSGWTRAARMRACAICWH